MIGYVPSDWLSPNSPSVPSQGIGDGDNSSPRQEMDTADPELGEQSEPRPGRRERESSDGVVSSDEEPENSRSPIEETGTPISAPVSPTSDHVGNRYPTRVRCPQNRFDPSSSGTFHYLVVKYC